jgi:hypothetical protein
MEDKMSMRKKLLLGIVFLFCLFSVTKSEACVWYFGSDPSTDYSLNVVGPVSEVLIPATLKLETNEDDMPVGILLGSFGIGRRNGELDLPGDGWKLKSNQILPNFNNGQCGALIHGSSYTWDVYSLIGDNDYTLFKTNLPEGTYDSVNNWLSFGIFDCLPIGVAQPTNNFKINVSNQNHSDPTTAEPATIFLLGIGLVGIMFIFCNQRKKIPKQCALN